MTRVICFNSLIFKIWWNFSTKIRKFIWVFNISVKNMTKFVREKTLTDNGFLEQVYKHKGKWLLSSVLWMKYHHPHFQRVWKWVHMFRHWFSQDPIKQNDCFWLVTHDDWSRWWHLKSLSPCTFLFMSGAWETINTLCETQNKRNHLISAKFKFHINTNCWLNCHSQHPLPRKKKKSQFVCTKPKSKGINK